MCNGHLPTGGRQRIIDLKPLPYMFCGYPVSGTDHSLKEVSANCIWYKLVHTWGFQVICHKLLPVLFLIYLQLIYRYRAMAFLSIQIPYYAKKITTKKTLETYSLALLGTISEFEVLQ